MTYIHHEMITTVSLVNIHDQGLTAEQAGFRKGRGTRDQTAKHPLDHRKTKRGGHGIRILWVFPSPLSLLKGPSFPIHVDERDYPMVVVGISDTCHYWIWIIWGQKLSLFYGNIPKVLSSGPDMRNVCWVEASTAPMKGNLSPRGDDLSSLREAL